MTLARKKLFAERGIGIAVLVFVLVAPQVVSGFWMDAILSQSFILGIGAASLVFLSAYGGMVAGSIATETTAAVLAGDSELQRRYLGVEPLAH